MDTGGSTGGRTPADVNGVVPAARTEEEEDAMKRKTDCFYYLASPLTCKKGSECEFRHSEGARRNLTNCWFWLNTGCLKPKCSYRHLPLDGMNGSQGRTSGSSQPAIETIPAMQVPGEQGSAYKKSTPCRFFMKGSCLKGDGCSFMHGPSATGTSQSASISVPQQTAKVRTEQPLSQKRDSWIPKEHFAQRSKSGVEISTEAPPSRTKPMIHAELSINNSVLQKNDALPFEINVEPKTQLSQVLPTSTDAPQALQVHQICLLDEKPQTGTESDEFLPESSPGFDVLADDHNEDTVYFRSDDEYDGRNLNPVNDFDYQHPDYESISQFESDRYNMTSEFEHDGPICDHPDWKQYRKSSERVLVRYSHDRQSPEREVAVNHIGVSDLRHLLVKQRRLNGSMEIAPSEHLGGYHRSNDSYLEDQHDHGSVRERWQCPERPISSRLHGRITLPNRSSPDTFDDQWDRVRRSSFRLLPARPTSKYQGKHQERIRRGMNGEQDTDIRGYVRQTIRKAVEPPIDFAGPKSLVELRAEKNRECSWNQAVKKDKKIKLESIISCCDPEVSDSFESPKPLSVILKRKRETASGNSTPCSWNKEHNKDVRSMDTIPGVNPHVQLTCTSEAVGYAEEEEEHLICPGAEELHYAHYRSASKDVLKVEHVILVDNTEGSVVNIVELKDREGDYDHADHTTEDEAMHQDDDNFDDDEEDFPEKVGLILS